MLVSYDFNISGNYPPFLLFDLFFQTLVVYEDGGTYADDFGTCFNDQGTWTLIDSTFPLDMIGSLI